VVFDLFTHYSKTVILRSDFAFSGVDVHYRVVDSAVAVKHFIGVHAMRKCDELMSQTDTENGLARLDNFGYFFNHLGQRLRVARSVRQEISVRIKAVELLFGAVVWKYFDITISFC